MQTRRFFPRVSDHPCGIGLHSDVYLWIPANGKTVAVVLIPFVGNLSDRIGRRIPIIAPPGPNVPMIVGSLAFGETIIAAVAAFTARETHRLRLEDLGNKSTAPIPEAEYERIRLAALAERR